MPIPIKNKVILEVRLLSVYPSSETVNKVLADRGKIVLFPPSFLLLCPSEKGMPMLPSCQVVLRPVAAD